MLAQKEEYKLFTLRDQDGRQMASLTYGGAVCFLKSFGLEKHVPELDYILDGEYAGYWLGDGANIDGQLVTAFTLTRDTWYCYSN